MMKLIAKQIHKGDKTHTQLQSITWQSFSTMKTIVRRPLNPMPPVDTFSDFLLLIFVYFLNVIITSFLYGFWGQESFWRDRLRLLYSNFFAGGFFKPQNHFFTKDTIFIGISQFFFLISTFQRYYNISKFQNIFRIYSDIIRFLLTSFVSSMCCPSYFILLFHYNVSN